MKDAKIAMVIASKDFRDEEYFVPKELFMKAGFKVVTYSDRTVIAVGAGGGDTEIDGLIDALQPGDFKAVVFVGGSGCLKSLDNEKSYKVIKETVSDKIVLGSICISPVILAKAGVLKDKKATVWSSPMDRNPVKILKSNGALYEDRAVVKDGNIITANGPGAAEEFARTILQVLGNS